MDERDRSAVRIGNSTRDRRDDMPDLFDDISDDLLLSKKVDIKRKQMMQRRLGISRNALEFVSSRDIKRAMADIKQVDAALKRKSLVALKAENNALELHFGDVRMKHSHIREACRTLEKKLNHQETAVEDCSGEIEKWEKKFSEKETEL